MKRKILILSHAKLDSHPRPFRQIKSLKDIYEVHAIGLAPPPFTNVNFFQFKKMSLIETVLRLPLLKLGMFERYYWDKNKVKLLDLIDNKRYDLIIAHDIRNLPFALRIANGAKIILDAHEYAPKNFDDSLIWRFFIKKYYIYLCKKYISKCDAMFTVSKGISEKYYKNFGIKSDVITNSAEYVELEPSRVDPEAIKIVHHGSASPSRKIDLMIKMMEHLDERFSLDLMLVTSRISKMYYNKLKRMVKGKNNVRIIPPVQYRDLIEFTNTYDIGIFLLPPTNFNLEYALPNKLYEFIQARLAVAIGPSIEMSRLVKRYDLGVIANDFTPKSMAKEINSLNYDRIRYYKNQSNKHAKILSSETNNIKIKKIVSKLTIQS